MDAEDDVDASGVLQSTRRFLLGTGLTGGKILPLGELLKKMGGDVSEERKREMKALFDSRVHERALGHPAVTSDVIDSILRIGPMSVNRHPTLTPRRDARQHRPVMTTDCIASRIADQDQFGSASSCSRRGFLLAGIAAGAIAR
jgi:hypothetical protein